MNQQYQEPFLAIVIDPTRTISAGKVNIGAFRTYPKVSVSSYAFILGRTVCFYRFKDSFKDIERKFFWIGTHAVEQFLRQGCWHCCCCKRFGNLLIDSFLKRTILVLLIKGYKAPDDGPDEYQTIPLNKIEDFGVHCKEYYSLEMSYFKSSWDKRLLESLWNKYWVSTLSSSSLLTVSGLFKVAYRICGWKFAYIAWQWASLTAICSFPLLRSSRCHGYGFYSAQYFPLFQTRSRH